MVNVFRALLHVFTVLFIISSHTAFALEVDIDEIKTKPIKFYNYQGTYTKKDSIESIENIGRFLANSDTNDTIKFGMKYSIIYAISDSEPEKFSAIIFSIDKQAKVGHIDIVRKILSAYLQQKFGYSRSQAWAISVFVTYYNAVYRGNIDYFSRKYKSIVMKFIHTKNAGISTKYYEWPGTTRMLIPLTAKSQNDKLNSIDIDIISDKSVLSQVKKDSKHLHARKDMADIKEQLLFNNKDKLEKDKGVLQSEIQKLDEEKKYLENKKILILQKEREIDKTKEDFILIPDSQKKELLKNDLQTKQKQLEKEKEEIKKKEDEIKKKESEIEQQQKKLEDTEKKLALKQKEIEDEKKDIALDEAKQHKPKDKETLIQKLEEKEKQLNEREDKLRSKELDKNIYADKLFYLKIKEYLQDGHYNNEMVMIDPANQKILFKSPEKNICGKRYDIFSGGVVVITHKGSHSIGHRLTILDRNTLVPIVYGKDNIFWRSFVEIRDSYIYAIVIENGKFYLGCFDTNLSLIAKSQDEVNENTFISFWDNYIYINRVDKTIMVLNKQTLQRIGTIHP